MISAAAALVLAFFTSTILTPVVRDVARRAGVMDQPGGRRVHQHATPRLGGVAVMIAFFLPLAAAAVLGTSAMRAFLERPGLVLGLVLGSLVVAIVGAIDDVRSVGPWAKLLAQAIAAVVAYAYGYCIDAIHIPFLGDVEMGPLALPVTVFWFLAITNAINLIDGLDGLASGIALFATITNFAVGYINGSGLVVLLSCSLAGSLLGFLRYNFNPATIFLGDSGSMFLGFVLAATSLVGATTKTSTAVAITVPVVAMGVPIVDTLLAMIRRALARQSIFAADRGHIHHRLLDLGFTHRRVVLTLYGLSVSLAVLAVAIAFGRSLWTGGGLSLLGLVLFLVVRAVRRRGSRKQSSYDELVAAIRRCADSLAAAGDEAGIRVCLSSVHESGGAVEAALRTGSFPATQDETPTKQELSFDVSSASKPRYLHVRVLDAEAGTTLTDLAAAFEELAVACQAALRRSAPRQPKSGASLQVASAHGTPSDD